MKEFTKKQSLYTTMETLFKAELLNQKYTYEVGIKGSDYKYTFDKFFKTFHNGTSYPSLSAIVIAELREIYGIDVTTSYILSLIEEWKDKGYQPDGSLLVAKTVEDHITQLTHPKLKELLSKEQLARQGK